MVDELNDNYGLIEKLEKEGKISYFDKPEHLKSVDEMNDRLQEFRRDYIIKDMESNAAAATVILTS